MVASLLSPNFKAQPPTLQDVKFASIIWGITLGLGVLTAWKAVEQMIPIWRRNRCTTSFYIWMVWILWLDNMIQGVVCWTFMDGLLKPGFPTFFGMIFLWAIQTQLILQIIINRSALIMVSRRKVKQLKYGVAFFVLLVNISVFCIWIPARLQTSEKFIAINQVWDRIEKVIFLMIDAGLNAYFLYLVKARLISHGLDKYKPLFNFNSIIVAVSIAMDVLLISMMNLKNSFSYIAFHPLAAMVKLYIELIMTELIIKVVQSSQPNAQPYNSYESHIHAPTKSNKRDSVLPDGTLSRPIEKDADSSPDGSTVEDYSNAQMDRYTAHISSKGGDSTRVREVTRESMELGKIGMPDFGIRKTVSMMVKSKTEDVSETSSLRELKGRVETIEERGRQN